LVGVGIAVIAELALLAVLIAGYALLAARLDRFSVGPALAFVLIGLVVSEDLFGPITVEPGQEPVKILAEITLTLVLFADASAMRTSQLRHDSAAIGRLLIVGLLLTIAIGTVGAVALFPSISVGLALLIGASLAPTDAALGQAVVTNPTVPARIRRVLNVESGLNDGIATPLVFFALALATVEGAGSSGLLEEALSEIAIGAAAGIGLGFVGGWLLQFADRRRWTSTESRQLFVLALAGSSYLVSAALGGNGFIAAFVGGLAFAAGSQGRESSAVRFTETQGSLLAIGVWLSFGLLLAGELSTNLWDVRAIAYAILSLTLFRMLPVAIALLGSRFEPLTVLFVGWFGPRGLASIVFLIIGLETLADAGVDPGPFAAAAAWTVLLSVVLHGLTARPFAARYGARMARLRPDAPEHEGDPPPPATRTSWGSRSGGEPVAAMESA
jgi:sodium/hydrogen antiporter